MTEKVTMRLLLPLKTTTTTKKTSSFRFLHGQFMFCFYVWQNLHMLPSGLPLIESHGSLVAWGMLDKDHTCIYQSSQEEFSKGISLLQDLRCEVPTRHTLCQMKINSRGLSTGVCTRFEIKESLDTLADKGRAWDSFIFTDRTLTFRRNFCKPG